MFLALPLPAILTGPSQAAKWSCMFLCIHVHTVHEPACTGVRGRTWGPSHFSFPLRGGQGVGSTNWGPANPVCLIWDWTATNPGSAQWTMSLILLGRVIEEGLGWRIGWESHCTLVTEVTSETSSHKTVLTLDTSHSFRGSQDHPHFWPTGYKFRVPLIPSSSIIH